VNRNPGERPGTQPVRVAPTTPNRRNRRLGARFRVPPFSVRRQNRFDETRRPGRSVLPFDTGRYGVSCHEEANCHEDTPSCMSSGKVALTGTPPNVRRRDLVEPVGTVPVIHPFSPAVHRRCAVQASGASENTRLGAGACPPREYGVSWSERRFPLRTVLTALDLARPTPLSVSCLLRHLSGSATPMLAGTGAKRAKSGVGR
jgi:hypothetical protein